ncbi:hypothetical protein HIM_00598 [Hirsutella minnesotensis 3608]|nr:hypothetical protein HIM_00598 [Hirsutella minnesotensis 3608]
MAATRDYYSDLELPPTADIQEIKKQFRKLALKYHPDRNPGREAEVNSKFQIIQSAHEVLSDPQQKARYDATYSRSRGFPGSSGVKGNPWQNVGQQFPPPPRRNATAKSATSGAQRWQTRFSNGVPPTAKQQTASDSEAKKNAARAFENMRKSQSQSAKSTHQETRPQQPPPPPPRTESARQRAQASFGSRKPGFQPHSSVPGDEPPVSSQNYHSRSGYSTAGSEPPRAPSPPPRKARPTAMPDPLSQFRENGGFADSRPSAPYSSHGGEKTNPFDGVPLGRTKSGRESSRPEEPSTSDGGVSEEYKGRTFRVPRSVRGSRSGSSREGTRESGQASNYSTNSTQQQTNPTANPDLAHGPENTTANTPFGENRPGNETGSGPSPSMYGTPFDEQKFLHSVFFASRTSQLKSLGGEYEAGTHRYGGLAPSGSQETLHDGLSFEKKQHLILDCLISNMWPGLQPSKMKDGVFRAETSRECANTTSSGSFTFAMSDDTFERTSPGLDPSRSTRSSVDDINTRFVNEETSSTWQFNAGTGDHTSPSSSRPTSRGRANRHSPLKHAAAPEGEHTDRRSPLETSSGFNADGWSDKFSPQTFVPQPASGSGASPTRPSRANSKKVRIRPTAGSAAVVEDHSSDDEAYEWRGRNAQKGSSSADSPQAMDIDSPPAAPEVHPSVGGSVRNIPVEPSRPEWRPGNVGSVASDDRPPRPEKVPIPANAAGSEDSEEFRATLADLKNVPPFAQPKAGLTSFADLKDNLPFESKASEDLPIKLPKVQPLVFPTPPEAPRLPPTVAIEGIKPNTASWAKYLEEFEDYLQKWDVFNGQVVDHFTTRKAHISRIRSSKGYAFLGARSDSDIREYFNWVQQDNDVRQRWCAACNEHEQRLREFLAFREKMK